MIADSFQLITFLAIVALTLIFWRLFPVLALSIQRLLEFVKFKASSVPFYITHFLGLIILLLGFIGTVAWFKQVDIYSNHFFNIDGNWIKILQANLNFTAETYHRLLYITHHFIRVIFTAYLFLICFSVGQLALNLMSYVRQKFELTTLDEIIVSFFLGVGLLQILLFIVGLMGYYSFMPMFLGSLIFLVIGYPSFCRILYSSLENLTSFYLIKASSGKIVVYSALIAIFSVSAVCLIFSKGLFPGGGGDYFVHYFPYYMEVIEQGGLAPNDIWYHFYNSKGASLVFYTVSLTDPHAPQLVSLCLFAGSVLVLYSLISKMAEDSSWSWVGITIYVSGLIYTFEKTIPLGYWAEFQKQHILTASLLAGIFWMVVQLYLLTPSKRGSWSILICIVCIGLYILRPQFAPLLIIFLGILGLVAFIQRQWQKLYILIGLGVFSVSTLLAILGLNYVMTGLAEVTPFRVFWRFANQEMFSQWVSPYLMVLLGLGSSPSLGEFSQFNAETLSKLKVIPVIFRLDRIQQVLFFISVLWAIILATIAPNDFRSLTPKKSTYLGDIKIFFGKINKKINNENHEDDHKMYKNNTMNSIYIILKLVGVFLLSSVMVMLLVINQLVSLYRLYVFVFLFVIILTVIGYLFTLDCLFFNIFVRKNKSRIISFFAIFISIICLFNYISEIPLDYLNNRLNFALGNTSIANAYQTQKASWEPGIEARKIVGSSEKIWSSQVTGKYCMSPGCHLETFFSYSMGKDWHKIVLEDAETSKKLLQQQGLNYFLIDTTEAFFDVLPHSELFSPDKIDRNLQSLWTDGDVYLLTWPTSQTKPLQKKFRLQYQESINKGQVFADFKGMYEQLKIIYNLNKKSSYPLKIPDNLPPVRGWQ